MLDSKEYSLILSPRHRLFDLHLQEAFRHRDLIFLFVKRDFVAAYKQTVFGPLWFFINPILTTLIFTVICGDLAGLPTLDAAGGAAIPGFLFYMAGNICWGLFSSTLTSSSNAFRSNAGLMSKVYYPRIISPVASALSHLITFGLQLAMFFVLYAFVFFTGRGELVFTWRVLMIPLIALQIMFLSVGCGILISSVTTKYRDLNMLVGLFVRFWQYATPIMYGLSLVSEKNSRLLKVYMLNPMTPIVTFFRYSAFGSGYFSLAYYLISWAITLAVLLLGLIMFSRIERSFVDTI